MFFFIILSNLTQNTAPPESKENLSNLIISPSRFTFRMSPSSVFVSGLNFEKLRQVMYALKNDIELSQVYYSTVYLVEEFYTLIATEMRSVKKDISYWEVLAESSQWEIYLTQLHNKIYRRMVDRGDASLYAVISRAFPVSLHSIKRLLGPPTLTVRTKLPQEPNLHNSRIVN